MTDIAKHQARRGAVNDESNVLAHPHRPKVWIFRLLEFVELHPGVGGIQLKVECGRFDDLLLVAGEPGEAVGERIGDSEVDSLPRM
jgi:hypothetical protein